MSGRPKKIGITGGIGSGKTLVSKIFSLLGVPVYNADERAKFILQNDPEVMTKVKVAFGEEAYQNNLLNAAYLSQQVFNNEEKLQQLNSFVHPKVAIDFMRWCSGFPDHPYILKEAALLYETNSYKDLDKIIVVQSPTELRIKRILQRDPKRTEDAVKAIMAKQLPEEAKVKKADYIILNDEKSMIIPQVIKLHQIFNN